jgi:hypothetical protein
MIKTISAQGLVSKPTTYGKNQIAKAMYWKGKNFLHAAVLLSQHGGNEYIVLHLLCQSIEIILKSLLLFKDFDSYKRRIKKEFSHNLEKLTEEALSQFAQKPLRPAIATQLRELNNLYSRHLLRYGSSYDLLVAPSSIKSDLIPSRILAAIKLADSNIPK